MMLRKSSKEVKQVANLQLVKETNLTLVFSLINRHEPVSRAELAQMTKLSPTTVSSLVEELVAGGMVVETGAGTTATSGRKPIMLEINPRGGCVASIELLEDGLISCLYDLKGREIAGSRDLVTDYDGIGQVVVEAVYKMLKANNLKLETLFGICIGVPGLIDIENYRVVSSTVIPIEENNDFYYQIKEAFHDIPVLLGNESSFAAYAEKEYGTGGRVNNLIFIDINTGIGAGIIIDGQIFTGSYGLAGEFGHITIDMNGPRCKCGNKGCLEMLASMPAISQRIIFGMMSGRKTMVSDMVGNDYNKINTGVIAKALELGDQLVIEVIDETASRLAFGINSAINLFNPDAVIIGGEIVKLGEAFLEKVKAYINTIGFKPHMSKVVIRYSEVPGNTVTLGGARYLLDNIFSKSAIVRNRLLYD